MANDSKYKVLVDTLKSAILSGKYDLDRPFPSERMLIRKYGHSRITVQHALRELERLGFVSRQQGRGTFVTKQGASRKIGLIVPGVAYSEYFSQIVSEIARLADKAEYMLLLGDMSSPKVADRARKAKKFAAELVKENVAGVIYQPFEFIPNAESINRKIVSLLDNAGIPVVLLDYDIEPAPERSKFDIVGINNMDAGYRLGNHLLSLGVRKIHFLLRPNSAPSGRNRIRGVITAINLWGGKPCKYATLEASPDDLAALKRHLRHGKPDAFVCFGDITAAIFKKTLEKAGLQVPQDVLLSGFNDLQIASLLTPPLTTIHQPSAQMAQLAFKRLLERIADPSLPPLEMYLPAPLVVRGSTCRQNKAYVSEERNATL